MPLRRAKTFARLGAVTLTVTVSVVAVLAIAQSESPFHVPVPGASDGDLPEAAAASDAPSAIYHRGERVDAPSLRSPDAADATARATADPIPGAQVYRPDRITSLDGTLGYEVVFTPSIAPFKRVDAFDAVRLGPGGTPELVVETPVSRPMEVPPARGSARDGRVRDRFWGEITLDLRAGDHVVLPSVSPETRILEVHTSPETELRFERDSAGNIRAHAPSPPTEGLVRLIWLSDAPRDHFNAEISSGRADLRAAEVAPLPPALSRTALAFARSLGIERGDPLDRTLSVLVEHFRSFRESERPPEESGDIYRDLATGGVGVCRHRAYAFVITAHALGIPAHFVQNEAHAWVEVATGATGFMRVDLGGAATEVQAPGLRDRVKYEPMRPDPFPRPPEYSTTSTAESALSSGASGDSGGSEGGEGSGGATNGGEGSAGSAGSETSSDREGGDGEGATRGPSDLRITVDRLTSRARRGHVIPLSGRIVRRDGAAAPGLRVEVVLRRERHERLLGVTVTGEDGRFRGEFGIPPELEVGDYALDVRTPGDGDSGPAHFALH